MFGFSCASLIATPIKVAGSCSYSGFILLWKFLPINIVDSKSLINQGWYLVDLWNCHVNWTWSKNYAIKRLLPVKNLCTGACLKWFNVNFVCFTKSNGKSARKANEESSLYTIYAAYRTRFNTEYKTILNIVASPFLVADKHEMWWLSNRSFRWYRAWAYSLIWKSFHRHEILQFQSFVRFDDYFKRLLSEKYQFRKRLGYDFINNHILKRDPNLIFAYKSYNTI